MAAISSLTTRSGSPRASSAAIRMLGHDVERQANADRRFAQDRLSKGALTAPRVLSARKTGLYAPDVETSRLVQDERGWLRLAG